MKHLTSEFSGCELGDKRLDKRLISIINSLIGSPEKSFPEVFANSAELEGFYRFVENPYVKVENILDCHIKATIERMDGKSIIIAHDSTEFIFSGKRKDLGKTSLGKSPSFFGHFSLAISASNKDPLGIVSLQCFKRGEKISATALRNSGTLTQKQARSLPSEKQRWTEAIDKISHLSESRKNAIHVCDSETDSYALLAELSEKKHRFVVRGCYDRALINGEHLRETFINKKTLFSKEIFLSTREKKSSGPHNKRLVKRDARKTTITVKASQLILKRSKFVNKKYDASLAINAVYILEKDHPKDEKPVEWILLTQEPIATRDEIDKIIEYYCSRWIIEEYFKALKTGCSYEKRQLENYDTLRIV